MELNPRNLREKLGPFQGKKVMIGTTDWHYICGVVQSVERSGELRLTVEGKPVIVPAEKVATIKEAPPHLAEYVK